MTTYMDNHGKAVQMIQQQFQQIEQLQSVGRELDDAICDLRNVMASPLIIEFGPIYTRLVSVQTKFRALTSGKQE